MKKKNPFEPSEEQFQETVIELARRLGYKVAHFRPAMKKDGSWITPVAADGSGFVDLLLVHPIKQRVIFTELKSRQGKLTPEQLIWADILKQAKQEYYLWRPEDWEEIVNILR